MNKNILIVDDERLILTTLGDELRAQGYDVTTAACIRHGLDFLETDKFFCVITDIRLPDGNGIDFLKMIKEEYPETQVIIITGHGTIESAVSAMKLDAFDYVVKPFYNEEIICILDKINQINDLKKENIRLKEEINSRLNFDKMIGKSKKMQDVFSFIKTVSKSDASVLIIGESGTGKELVAEAIHEMSPRKNKPLIKVNCSVFTQTLLEDELFGHEKGAYTGAINKRSGRFELAHGGTLFLDDIDDINLETQVKLLRAIQEKEFERIGGTETIKVDIHIISASKKDLREEVNAGRFREDLFYRLNVVPIKLPPLRERKEDIPLLVDHFARIYGQIEHVKFSSEAMNILIRYDWPGNVRELENSIEGTLALVGEKEIIMPEDISNDAIKPAMDVEIPDSLALEEYIQSCEKEHLKNVLKLTGGQKNKASGILKISRKALWQKIKKYNIDE